MSEQAAGGTTAGPDPEPVADPARAPEPVPTPVPTPVSEPESQLRHHKAVRAEDLPEFSIGAPVVGGIVIWLALLVVFLIKRDALDDAGNGWWVWCALTGVILGMLGFAIVATRLKDQPGQVDEPPPPLPEPVRIKAEELRARAKDRVKDRGQPDPDEPTP